MTNQNASVLADKIVKGKEGISINAIRPPLSL